MVVSELINKILDDIGDPLDGTGFWSRPSVRRAINDIQREISSLCENILAFSAKIEPAKDATEITVDADGNYLRTHSADRTYGGQTREIFCYTRDQIVEYDQHWKTRTATLIRGLITDVLAIGKLRPYPIPDNADNDIYVNYIKLATRITAEYVEAGDANNQVTNWILAGLSSANTYTGYKLYWELTNTDTTRTVKLYKDSAKQASDLVAQGTHDGDGVLALSEQNNSGVSGQVTVAFSINDTDTSNILTFTAIEIPESDVPCLEYGVKATLYSLEKDGKDANKAAYWLSKYGAKDPKTGLLSGELATVRTRARKQREGRFHVIKERDETNIMRTRPFYEWE